jgi:hypothetical protein
MMTGKVTANPLYIPAIKSMSLDVCNYRSPRRSPIKKRIPGERRWFPEGVRYWQRQDFHVIYELKEKYPVTLLCEIMGVNRSGYYKWIARRGTPNRYEQD